MNYIEARIKITAPYQEILMAELAEIGYESFVEEVQQLLAYIPANLFDQTKLEESVNAYQEFQSGRYEIHEIPAQNWNQKWESAYEPVFIGQTCVIRSTFHQIKTDFPYEIVINPKMSFGTGHHATTQLMIEMQLLFDHQQKKILDVGCGTGVLSIMAEKLGATHVFAIDIEAWAYENTKENIELNKCKSIGVSLGSIQEVPTSEKYDIILANINKNVLIKELNDYQSHLQPNGVLIMSGFFVEDAEDIRLTAYKNDLKQVNHKDTNNWLSLAFRKI